MEFRINDPKEMTVVAQEIIARAAANTAIEARAFVCTLSGDLGAGKTTLTQTLAVELGITESIQSPTFVIRKRYETKHPIIWQLIHIDAYRLETGVELEKLRFSEDLAQPHTIICMEWPQQVADLGLQPDISIHIEHAGENARTLILKP